ncbi:hypothetical protein EUX98_g4104 [Antrodiella citrinella]|uniref:Mediator of RNA polymerase II transcription subunit 5 n=1 Tax=Antrodiella citrinella TaxID=2447956 RepID=A0A4V3XIQ3_9APHY|nr:hypothetical protein EUX98_g4104 [Antrodiella citrinella]
MTPAEVRMESDSQAERPPSEVLEDHIAELEAAAEPEASPEPSTESVDVGSGKENVEEESTPFIATSEDIGEAEAIEPSVPDEVSAPADTPPEPTTSTESVPDATLHADATAAPATIEIISPPALAPLISPSKTDESDIEALQQRLKLVEQRFADVSTSFKRLQAEKAAADLVLREFTPLESMQDTEALNDYLQNMNLKNEMAQDEIRRLTGKLTRKVLSSAKPEFEADSDAIGQDERIEELRDTHHLESKSQSDQIEKLRAQRDESEALLKASQATQSEAVEEAKRKKAELDALHLEVEKVKNTGKEEEEKRVKAIALLKTVRQKLVKAEKERDDATRELHTLREKERDERDKFQEEKQNLLADIETVNHERETAIVGLRSQFDRELTAVKERHEKEQLALRGQYELEAVTTKALYTKELEAKTSRVAQLESIVQTLRTDKDDLFDQLQMRQAELESSRHLQETLQSQSSEFQYQIRESTERIALLQDELAETQRSHAFGVHSPSASADEVSRLLLEAEAKYESRLAEFRRQLSDIERERDEGEADWSRKLVEKVKEIDALKRTVSQSLRSEDDERERMYNLKEEITRLKEELRVSQVLISDLKGQAGKIGDVEATVRSQLADANSKANALQQQLEEFQSREAQLKANNKTLRDELRKVQSSAALLERQRNPGVGYWAARPDGSSETRSPRSSVSDLQSPNGQTSRPGSPAGPSKSDEEVNFEYLRNVILQFLEHQEMRWLKLCKLFISQNLMGHAVPSEAIHLELSNSVLVLHTSYPGDPALRAYLKAAIQDGVLPLAAFVTAFLSGARSPDLHNLFTLDSLCQVIVESHYASGMPPIGRDGPSENGTQLFTLQLTPFDIYGLSNPDDHTTSEKTSPQMWKAFVIGRLPHIIAAFEKAVEHDGIEPDWRFAVAASALDIDTLGQLCKIMYSVDSALDILSLHANLPDMLAVALALVEDYDCETVGDPQTAITHVGDVVLFLQYTLARFHLSNLVFHLKGRELRPDVLFAGSVTHRVDSKGEDVPVFNAWFKALFDSNSEGIEDTILRSTRPKILLRLAGTLFSHAIQQCTDRKLDKDVMINGFSYFSGQLLNWTLIGVVKVLLTEIEQKFMRVPLYQDILQTLVTSSSCPQPVLRLTAGAMLRLFPAKFTPLPGLTDHTKIRRVALEALKRPADDAPVPLSLEVADWNEIPRRDLRNALSAARSERAPSLDVDRCLLYMAPTKFLQVVWNELSVAITMGELETPRRLATYILSHPRPSNSPPLLPIFFHVVLSGIVTSLDHAQPAEQTMAVELLVAIISSALTAALHIEWALLSVCDESQFVLGQSVSAMARRLGGDLRKNTGSQTSEVIAQRLSSSHSFVTNFPTFMAEA